MAEGVRYRMQESVKADQRPSKDVAVIKELGDTHLEGGAEGFMNSIIIYVD